MRRPPRVINPHVMPAGLLVVLAFAVPSLTDALSDSVRAVFSQRDLLDQILNRIPLSSVPVWDDLSRTHVVLRHLLDSAAPYSSAAIQALGPQLREEVRARLNPPRALFVCESLLEQVESAEAIVLARHLVNAVGLDIFADLLPGVAIQYGCPLDLIIQLLEVAPGREAATDLVPESIVGLVEQSVDEMLATEFRFMSDFFPYDGVESPDTEQLLMEWRRSPQILQDRSRVPAVVQALGQPMRENIPDLRLFFRSYCDGYGGFNLLQDPVVNAFTEFCNRIPAPFHFVFVNPGAVAQLLLKRLPREAATDPGILLALRRIGIAFHTDDYMERWPPLECVAPYLDSQSVDNIRNEFVRQHNLGKFGALLEIPDITSEMFGHESKPRLIAGEVDVEPAGSRDRCISCVWTPVEYLFRMITCGFHRHLPWIE